MAEVVGGQLDLVAVERESSGGGHRAGVQQEDIEFVGGSEEGSGGGLDGGEGGQVEPEGMYLCDVGGTSLELGSDLGDGLIGFSLVAGSQPDGGWTVVACEIEDALFS